MDHLKKRTNAKDNVFEMSQFFLKMGHSRPLFCLFNTVDSKQMFNINFANDWIQTADLWYQKQLLYQLSHNHWPWYVTVGVAVISGFTNISSNPLTSYLMFLNII